MNKLQGYIGQHRKYSQYFIITIYGVWDSQMALVVKNPHANAGDVRDAGSMPGQEDLLEKGTANHSNILAWRMPWTEQPVVHEVAMSQIQLK